MTGRRREGLAPNLFPFLAVLICTLGTLILLLALVAQNAGDAVAASTEPKPSAEQIEKQRQLVEADSELDRRIGEAKWHREQVVKIRDEQTAEIDERRTRQSHLEDHVNRLRDELKRLEAEIEAAQDDSVKPAASKDAIAALKASVDEEKSKIEKLKTEQQSHTPRIVIVPHKGPNGTDRRPIYIECRADGVYIQPGNVAIDPKYLENNIPGLNPLDAALKAIRLYAMKNYGDLDAPYPLIVVRPDGIETYAAARYAMKDWDDQYGYELVPGEVKLAYPEPDAVLNDQVDNAIAKAVREQQAYVMGTGGGGGQGGARSGRGRGGPGSGVSGDGLTGLASNDDVPNSPNSLDGTSGLAGRSPVQRRVEDLPVLSARNMDAEMAARLESSNFGSGKGQSIPSRFAARQAEANASAEASASEAKAGAVAVNRGSTDSVDGVSGDGQRGFETVGSGKLEQKQASSYAGLSSPTGSSASSPSASSNSTADRFAPISDQESKSKQGSGSTDPNAPLGGSLASGASSDSNPAGTTTPPPDSMQNAPPKGTPSPSVTAKMNGQKPSKSTVKRGSKDWALPPHVAAMVGTTMVRTIRVECHEDRLVLLPEGGKGSTNVYGYSDGDIDRATLELATAIRDRVDGWGAGMPGGRWQPLMEVNVVPGGEFRFQQLRRLMDRSGVTVEAKGAAK